MKRHKPNLEEIIAKNCDACFVPFDRVVPKDID